MMAEVLFKKYKVFMDSFEYHIKLSSRCQNSLNLHQLSVASGSKVTDGSVVIQFQTWFTPPEPPPFLESLLSLWSSRSRPHANVWNFEKTSNAGEFQWKCWILNAILATSFSVRNFSSTVATASTVTSITVTRPRTSAFAFSSSAFFHFG